MNYTMDLLTTKNSGQVLQIVKFAIIENGVPLGNHSVNKKSSITFKAFYSFMNDFTPKGTFSVFITVFFFKVRMICYFYLDVHMVET